MSENPSNVVGPVCLICGQSLPTSTSGAMCRACATARRMASAARSDPGGGSKMALPPVQIPSPGGPSRMALPPVQIPSPGGPSRMALPPVQLPSPGGPSKMALPPVQLPSPGGPSKMALPPVQLPSVAPPSGMHRPLALAGQAPSTRPTEPTASDSQDNLAALSQSRLPAIPRNPPSPKSSTGSSSRSGSVSSVDPPPGPPGTGSSSRTHGLTVDPSGSTPTLPPGKAPPGYQILGELGRGGMGVVYKARDTRLGRLVALKMLLAGGHVSAASRRRFRTEGEAVARLDHASIVQIYEVGEHDGLPYFALEYLPGGSLDQKLNGRPMGPEAAAELTETVARAVFAAHQAGLIHRDIKPGNILLTEDGRAKLTDFGLAKQVGDSTGDGSGDSAPIGAGMTATGAMMGTPSYMAPEQVEGGRAIGPAADIYALGAVLYQLLTGRPPFLGDTEIHTVYQVMTQEPVPVTRLQPRVPADLETICLKCLAKEPNRRYATAQELAEDLRRFLSAEPIKARPTGWLEHTVKWARRKPAIAGLLGVSMLAAVAMILAGVAFNQKLAAAKADVERERDKLADRSTELEKAKQNAENALRETETARQQADRNAAETDQERQAAKDAEAQARRLNVQLLIDKGVALCQRGEVDVGLLWLGRALESLDPKDANSARLEATIRLLLGGWVTELPVPTVLLLHKGPVTELALDPEGRWMISGVHNQSPSIWELPSGRPLANPLGTRLRLSAVAVSRDGSVLATCSPEKFLRFWDGASLVRSDKAKPAKPPAARGAARLPAVNMSFPPRADPPMENRGAAPGKPLPPLPPLPKAPGPLPKAPPPLPVAPADPLPQAGPAVDPVDSDATVTAAPLGGAVALPSVAIAVALSSDGKTAVTAHADRTIRLWDVATGSPRGDPIKAPSTVRAVAFSPDGRMFAVAAGTQILLRRVADQQRCAQPIESEFGFSSVDFAPSGKLMVTGCSDNSARVWDITPIVEGLASLRPEPPAPPAVVPEKPAAAPEPPASEKPPEKPAAAPEKPASEKPPEKLIVPPGLGSQLPAALAVGRPSRHRYSVTAVAFHPLGERFLTGSADATLRLWRASDGMPDTEFVRHQDRVQAVAFTRDGRWAATASDDGSVRLWLDLGNLDQRLDIPHPADLRALALTPDGTQLAVGAADGLCIVRNVKLGNPLYQPLLHPKGLYSLAFSRDGATFATGCDDFRARLFETATGNPIGEPMVHPDRVTNIVFLPNGKSLATTCYDGKVRFWDARTGRALSITAQTGDPNDLNPDPAHGLSADNVGEHFLVGSWNRTARLWSLSRMQAVGPDLRHLGGLSGTAISPDGRTLLTVGWDMTGRLWTQQGQSFGDLMRHEGVVFAGGFSSDGRLVATASWDGTARLWEAATGYPIGRPFWHGQRVFAAVFGPDGKHLFTIAGRHLLRWNVPESYTGNVRSLRPWLELHTGVELLPNGTLSELSTDAWLRRYREAFPSAYKLGRE